MKYVLQYKNRNLSRIFANSNGTVKDIIRFSNKSYFTFNDEGGAWDYLHAQHDTLIERKNDLAAGLFDKVNHIINNIDIKIIEPTFFEENAGSPWEDWAS
jgi:hypothetical protein